tara:strand:- start:47237 stop:48265 length:1029 start_codon:yes stop_codon:yes gene_type:complete
MTIAKLMQIDAPFIVAEIGQNHDGSLGMCHAYIDALADAGADAVKFQTHIAAAESTKDEAFRVKFSNQDATRYDYWRRMEFSEEQWRGLKAHADERGIMFLSTAFSAAAVELLERIGLDAWKIGSGDVLAEEILAPILASGKPIIASSGMSSWQEIDSLVERLRSGGSPFAIMQCTSAYPTALPDVGLNVLAEMRERYDCRIGLSDHSGRLSPALCAIARGFGLIEVHATFDRRMFGPDVRASLTVEEIGQLALFARETQIMDSSPVDKDAKAAALAEQKALFARSVSLREDRKSGYELSLDDLTEKKPGGGIPSSEREALVGRVLQRDVASNRLLRREDLK